MCLWAYYNSDVKAMLCHRIPVLLTWSLVRKDPKEGEKKKDLEHKL